MFSNGITKPEVARTISQLEEIITPAEDYDVPNLIKDLIEQGYVGVYEETKYFLLGKGIIAVAAIFT
jgi:hypothetical protein